MTRSKVGSNYSLLFILAVILTVLFGWGVFTAGPVLMKIGSGVLTVVFACYSVKYLRQWISDRRADAERTTGDPRGG